MNNRERRATQRRTLARSARYALLIAAVIAAVVPVYWMLTISLKSEVDQFASPPKWFTFTPTLAHYRDAFSTRWARWRRTGCRDFACADSSTEDSRCGYCRRGCFLRSSPPFRCF